METRGGEVARRKGEESTIILHVYITSAPVIYIYRSVYTLTMSVLTQRFSVGALGSSAA